ncbi:MAG: acetoin utilization protein, partial [Rhodospirillaceae bacterium]|nr:acetoin utilization protein [Rhodospirillaceae bacterium]
MGFCVFNNVVIGGVEQARKAHGLKRVVLVDFDVHHGNGTQTVYRADPDVMVASIHQAMIFPMSGAKHETGAGNIVNVPILRNVPAAQFRDAFETGLLPRLRDFRPELILLSAGFDAHLSAPLADQKLAPADFTWLTEQLMEVADSCCGGRLVSILKGGYNSSAVAQSGAAHVCALMRH